jgi:hypothetical protein|tara:strand:- start:539 stop:751 length:213 start_codon:yes stop_codon:yes gene_type:complete
MNIELTEIIDNGDGSVFAGVELDNEAYMAVVTIGLNAILRSALEDATEDEEAVYEDWIAEEVTETETKGD